MEIVPVTTDEKVSVFDVVPPQYRPMVKGGLTLIGALIAIYVLYKAYAWLTKPAPTEVTVEGQNPSDTLSTDQKMRVNVYVDKLYNDLKGWGYSRNVQAYTDLVAEPNNVLAAVYQQFNKQHESDSGETLIGWIKSDWTFWPVNQDWLAATTGIIKRYAQINITK